MMTEEQHNRCFYWRKNPEWYRRVDNTYQAEPTDKAPEKARESYAKYKKMVDDALAEMGATPYEGIRIEW